MGDGIMVEEKRGVVGAVGFRREITEKEGEEE